MKNNLPPSWSWVKLGDVINRMTNGCSARQFKEPGDYPITRIETISYGEINLNRVRYVNDVSEKDIDKYKLEFNDILFSHINSDYHLGKTAIFKKKDQTVLHGINLLLLRANTDIILPELLNYLFNFYRIKGEFLKIAQHAVNQSSINQKKLKNLDIPLPPLPEQRRIVEKIEELFSELDNGIENLKKAKAQIKTYRQAVLKFAFEGKLTQDKREKIKDKSEDGELPEGWERIELGKILKVNSGKGLTSANMKEDGEFPVYGGNGITGYYSEYLFEDSKLIIGRVGAKCGVVHITKPKSWVTDNALIVTFLQKVNTSFFYYCLSYHNLNRLSVSTAQPVISGAKIYPYMITLPPIEQQTQIVEEIERRFSVADKMEAAIDESLKKSEALRQSILKQAFEGKLV